MLNEDRLVIVGIQQNKGSDILTTDTIERIQKAEAAAEKIEADSVLKAEQIVEASKNEAEQIIKDAKNSGEAFLREKLKEAQILADKSSAENQKLIDETIAAMDNDAQKKYDLAVKRIKDILI